MPTFIIDMRLYLPDYIQLWQKYMGYLTYKK